MKKPLSLLFAVSCAAIATGPRLGIAQENPERNRRPSAERPAPEERIPLGWPEEQRREGQRGPGQRGAGPEMRLTPFIGVVTREVTPDVRAHVGLQEGFGLMVAEVLPESPAQTAGIKPHDILVALGDQRLAHVDQLMALVRERKKGDQIVLTLKRGGEEQKITVTVGEKNMPAAFHGEPRGPGMSFWGSGGDGDRRFQFRFDGNRGPGEIANEVREHTERFRRMMEEYRERLQDWARGPKEAPMPEAPRFDGPGRREGRGGERPEEGRPKEGAGEPKRPATQAEAKVEVRTGEGSTMFQRNVTRRDDTGEYTLRQENGKTTYTVRPKDGKEQSFEVNTPEQREALPAPYREKLREMEKINSEPGEKPPAPEGEVRKAEPARGAKGTI